ncbi:hypothetical protein C0989_008331, partial [Termitomyces sp. Mn162]
NPERPESAFRNSIPKPVLQHARGLKAGFVFSGMAGPGIVVARLPDGPWPAPFCIATSGLGWGLQIGADIIDFVIVNSFFVGTSLEGPALIECKDADHDFYGSSVPAKDIFTGRVPSPEVASRLYGIIEAKEQ